MLFFGHNLKDVREITRRIDSAGIAVDLMDSTVSVSDQIDRWRKFNNRIITVLVGRDLMARGIDFPNAKTIFVCRQTPKNI